MNNEIFFFFYNLSHKSDIFDAVAGVVAIYFIFILIIFALLFLLRDSKWKEIISLCVSGGVAWVLAKLLKILIHTDRPFVIFPQVQELFIESGYAFPSGHTMVASAVAFSLFFVNKKLGYTFMCFALLIGMARVVAGVHFPIDILGGFVFGSSVAYLVAYFAKNV